MADLVLVHDAARPLLTAALAEAVIAALDARPRCRRGDRGGAGHRHDQARATTDAVLETLDRSELWAVQTPQVFRRGALERALEVSAEELARRDRRRAG